MAHIEVRPARTEDRERIIAFCTQTWEWGDYIADVWDRWLHDADGRLLVATADAQPAGLVHIQMLDAAEAWLEGLRVDPQQRQQGIARALTEAALLEALQRGAEHVRLTTESENSASIHLSESLHMHRVGSFALYHADPLMTGQQLSASERTQLAGPDDLDAIIDYLNASNVFPLTGGLYHVSFVAYPITAKLLEEKIAARQIYLLRRWERLDGLAIAEPREESGKLRLSLGYIDGTTIESISLIAYDLRRKLVELELERMRVYAPDYILIHDALGGIGFENSGLIFYTYERGLI